MATLQRRSPTKYKSAAATHVPMGRSPVYYQLEEYKNSPCTPIPNQDSMIKGGRVESDVSTNGKGREDQSLRIQ